MYVYVYGMNSNVVSLYPFNIKGSWSLLCLSMLCVYEGRRYNKKWTNVVWRRIIYSKCPFHWRIFPSSFFCVWCLRCVIYIYWCVRVRTVNNDVKVLTSWLDSTKVTRVCVISHLDSTKVARVFATSHLDSTKVASVCAISHLDSTKVARVFAISHLDSTKVTRVFAISHLDSTKVTRVCAISHLDSTKVARVCIICFMNVLQHMFYQKPGFVKFGKRRTHEKRIWTSIYTTEYW